MKQPESKFPTITIRWADHWIENGDQDLKDVIKEAKPMYGNYTGFLVFENKQVIVLCSNYWDGTEGEDLSVSDPMYIMKRAVVYRSDKSA